ncbi:DUF6461 domain-containing protein [Actinokineospora sp. PR83]|uniref:DUF6461 domain-containing protein n=1 Tax=Actinokineospora sp. PR83 TaxID=2884908 RepID=UPI0027E1FD8C|nr:DUF6461 domain-containing protein [Actinokineospora sp. PR83]MCG8917424.1 DUF6461 domain-containing protein [Actinokineospora sp. PR83]
MLEENVPLDDLVRKYDWVREIEAWTVAVISDRTTADVAAVYGAREDSLLGDHSFGQLGGLQGQDPLTLRHHVQVFEHDHHVVTVENNGWSGSHPEVARRCSTGGGHFFSVYWNVNAFGLVTEAKDGVVTARFEMLYPVAPSQEPGEIRPAWAIGPELETAVARQACLALMEQQTGVAFDPYWLGQQFPTYHISESHVLYPDADHGMV